MDFLAFLSGLPLTFSQECLFFNLQLREVYFEMGFMQQNIIGSEVEGDPVNLKLTAMRGNYSFHL